MIGTQFKHNGATYQVTGFEELDASLVKSREALARTGKDLGTYSAAKVLKNGSLSEKQTGLFYRFTETNNFISIF